MMKRDAIRLFAPSESRALGAGVAAQLGLNLDPLEERAFGDGEHSIRASNEVRGHECFIVQSLFAEPDKSVNDKLCRLLFFVAALKDAAARRVNAVVPYLCYARADRRTDPNGPVILRYLAQLIEAAGTDRVIVMDVHNLAAFENAFRCQTDHLEAAGLFVNHFAPRLGKTDVVVISPDAGGMKRAERFRGLLSRKLGREVASAFLEKHRSGDRLSGGVLIGSVEHRAAIILDDLISTGGTTARAASACREQGAHTLYAAATHGIFVGNAGRILAESGLEQLAVTNSVPPFRLDHAFARDKLTVLDAAPLLAEAVHRCHLGESIPELLD